MSNQIENGILGESELAALLASIPQHDSMEVSTGGKFDFPFLVERAYFTTDAGYNNGESVILKLEGRDRNDNTEWTEIWSIGKDWDAVDNNTRAQSNGKSGKFNSQSTIGTVISMIKSGKLGKQAILDILPLDAREAQTWVGRIWQMGAVEMTIMGEKKVKRLPVGYLGKVGGGNVSTTQTAAPASFPANGGFPAPVATGFGAPAAGFGQQQFAPPATTTPATSDPILSLLTPEQIAQVKPIAAQVADNTAFMQAVPMFPFLLANPQLSSAVFTGQLLAALRAA